MAASSDSVRQPELPDAVPWPDVTIAWWESIGKSSQAKNFSQLDWLSLLDTALCHADVWAGNLDRLNELRVRLDGFGFTPASSGALGSLGTNTTKAVTPLDELGARRSARGAASPGRNKAKPKRTGSR